LMKTGRFGRQEGTIQNHCTAVVRTPAASRPGRTGQASEGYRRLLLLFYWGIRGQGASTNELYQPRGCFSKMYGRQKLPDRNYGRARAIGGAGSPPCWRRVKNCRRSSEDKRSSPARKPSNTTTIRAPQILSGKMRSSVGAIAFSWIKSKVGRNMEKNEFGRLSRVSRPTSRTRRTWRKLRGSFGHKKA